jgi:2-polyprenyl-3-methyl-5-hydroxy-6-metoxy-1,4-benzoquinol methylase
MDASEQCPLCSGKRYSLLYRGHISLFQCKSCSAVFNASHRPLEYDATYFNEEYRSQYGESYLEDFQHIYALSKQRLERIKTITQQTSSMLDIGSAYGFFLKAAQDDGFKDLSGIEISREGARYCESTFGIPVHNTNFENIEFSATYSIITAWYFIEHVSDPKGAIVKIANALQPGGVFACSVPSTFGPQFMFHRKEWYQTHPVDHRVNFSPKIIRSLLRTLGFSKIITYPGGIHPNRFLPKTIMNCSPARSLYTRASFMLSFSDTLEVYARK